MKLLEKIVNNHCYILLVLILLQSCNKQTVLLDSTDLINYYSSENFHSVYYDSVKVSNQTYRNTQNLSHGSPKVKLDTEMIKELVIDDITKKDLSKIQLLKYQFIFVDLVFNPSGCICGYRIQVDQSVSLSQRSLRRIANSFDNTKLIPKSEYYKSKKVTIRLNNEL